MKHNIRFGPDGLVPVVVQDYANGDVLMVAYANLEALEKSRSEGRAWFYSRSRQGLWLKGETSGNFLYIKDIRYDCDADTILYRVKPTGPACHTGERTCFYRTLSDGHCILDEAETRPGDADNGKGVSTSNAEILLELYRLVRERRANPRDGSYVNRLLVEGRDRIIQKVGEEAIETVIAAKNNDDTRLVSELADFLFHGTVMLAERGVSWESVFNELARRRK